MVDVKEYEKSSLWKNKSKKILENKYIKCSICGRSRWKFLPRKKQWKRVLRFAVHHIRYDNSPDEHDEDLMVLCSVCHTYCHDILRLRKLGESKMWKQLANIVEKYFFYEGAEQYKGEKKNE